MHQKTTDSWRLAQTIPYKCFGNMRELFVYGIEVLNQILIKQDRTILRTIKVSFAEIADSRQTLNPIYQAVKTLKL